METILWTPLLPLHPEKTSLFHALSHLRGLGEEEVPASPPCSAWGTRASLLRAPQDPALSTSGVWCLGTLGTGIGSVATWKLGILGSSLTAASHCSGVAHCTSKQLPTDHSPVTGPLPRRGCTRSRVHDDHASWVGSLPSVLHSAVQGCVQSCGSQGWFV